MERTSTQRRWAPGTRLSSPGERETNAVIAIRVGVSMLQFCSVSPTPSHSKTFSNPFDPFQIKWEVYFSKELCRSYLLCCRYDSACMCIMSMLHIQFGTWCQFHATCVISNLDDRTKRPERKNSKQNMAIGVGRARENLEKSQRKKKKKEQTNDKEQKKEMKEQRKNCNMLDGKKKEEKTRTDQQRRTKKEKKIPKRL